MHENAVSHHQQTGIIILAAGNSSRLRKPKQLLQYQQQTLLKKITQTALSMHCGPVIVVLGNDAENFYTECGDAIIVINKNWMQGMSSSIVTGLEKLKSILPNVNGVIITVCDQPYVTTSLLQQLITIHEQCHKSIVASAYNNTSGTPAYFHHSVFKELLQLQGEKGAKEIINKKSSRLATVDFPEGTIDVDTEEDYLHLLQYGKLQ